MPRVSKYRSREQNTRNQFRAFVRDTEGTTAIEYGLIAPLIALVIIGAVTTTESFDCVPKHRERALIISGLLQESVKESSMKRIFYCREKRRSRRIRYIITSLAALGITAATGLLVALVSAAGNLAGALLAFPKF